MSSNKPWDRPWSMEEIIENSDNWSLAGDVALLNTLKSFADNLISKTTEINNNLQSLTNNLDETSLKLNIAQNEFQSLRNSQFIESRVYEDDETLPQVENNEKVEEPECDRTEDIRLAAMKGLEVLDRYFDKVEVSVSDSEDEDIDLPNYVLRPKDLYIDRPLPYVIGSDEWNKTWHVGLEVSSSDSETEKVSDKYSESDSEDDLPIIQDRSQIKETSDTSSEFDYSQKGRPVKQDLFQSSDSEDSVPVQPPVSNFAEELAAKLGNVIKQEIAEPEINRRPIQTKSHYGDVFFDEPPPLDDNKGLFFGGGGLFDDDDDDAQYSTPIESKIEESPKLSKPVSDLFEGSDDEIFSGKKTVLPTNKPPLFTEEPPELEEKKKPVGGVSIFGGANLFDKKLLRRQHSSDDEESEDIFEENKTVKKIDLFDDGDLFTSSPKEFINKNDAVITKKINLFESDEETEKDQKLFEQDQNVTIQNNQPKETTKISLFDDNDLFKDDLFSSNTTKKKFTSGLFDDIDTQDDLFITKDDKPQQTNLLTDLMAIPDNKNSINVNTKIETKEHASVISDDATAVQTQPEPPKPKPRISLFDSPPPETDDLFNFDHPPQENATETKQSPDHTDPTPSSNIFDTPETDLTKNSKNGIFSNIFDTSLSDQDDLFAEKAEKPPESPNLFAASTPETKILPNVRLFDSSPPPDDNWETKSDNISDENESVTDLEDVVTQKSTLFSDEPPSLDLTVNKSKVSDITEKFEKEPQEEIKPNLNSPGKLKHNLNINVGALMPGSIRPKRESSVEVEPTFDTTDNVEVLHSVTKDRARVPLKRRPSTRRGRKAALQNITNDFKLEQEDVDSKIEDSSSQLPSLNSDSLFESLKNDDLVESEPPKLIKSDLFDDTEDDMFTSKTIKQQTQLTKAVKKSLFDDDNDDDDDDDIFKSFASANTVRKPDGKVATEKKIPKVSSVKKLENTKPDDDPLSALLN